MSISILYKELLKKKKLFIFITIIGFVVLGTIGYLNKDTINNGIVYCSEAKLFVEDNKNERNYTTKNEETNANSVITTSDNVIRNVEKYLESINIPLSFNEIKDSIYVEESGEIITIYSIHRDSKIANELCDVCSKYAVYELAKYNDGTVDIVNMPREAYSAVVLNEVDTDNPNKIIKIITPKAVTEINSVYVIKEIVTKGMLGGSLFLFVALFINAVIIYFKEDSK